MKLHLRIGLVVVALLLGSAMNATGFIPNDSDGDGVPDSTDACPGENSAGFDRNGDGCIDDAIGARHIEYWGAEDSVVTYMINADGAPGVAGTADNAAVQAAFAAWTAIPGTGLAATYGGTTSQAIADGLDHMNLVTFVDNTYPFGLSTLAVGLTTSFESDTLIAGRVYRKGEIYDSDMIFSPTKIFKAGGAGPGSDIQSVATHEAGHIFGISHTAIKSSTMFYVLPGGFAARSLTSDDEAVYYKAYATPASLAAASRLSGVVHAGSDNHPVPGVLVFALPVASPTDTAACEITLPDGSFTFAGLPNGSYYVAIHPLDGTSSIGYINAANINTLVDATVENDFQPEYYDAAESNADDPTARTGVAVAAGSTSSIEIVTNVDVTPPVALDVTPDGSAPVAIDGAFVIRFSERIDVSTIKDAFSFHQGTTGIGGNIAAIRDDSVLVFTPTSPLDFSSACTLEIDTGLTDRAGNHLASTVTASFTTEAEPPLSISSLAPNKGVPGTTIVINGRGFSTPAPTVAFDGHAATVVSAGPAQLVVVVPDGVTTGNVIVTNADLSTSNALVFTALSDQEVARGYESGSVNLAGAPNAVTVSPDGVYAYVAEPGGVDAVVVDAGAGAYLTRQLIANPGVEYTDVAVTPDGNRAYAVSETASELTEIMTDPTSGLLFNKILSSRMLNAEPRGIEVDPAGSRAYISTDAAEIQVWDVRLGSPTYQQQVGVLESPDEISLPGPMAITPDGKRLLALGSSGEVFFYDLGVDTLWTRVGIDLTPRGIAIDPQGERAYVAHDGGTISVVSIGGVSPFFVQSINTGGSLRGLDTTPAGLYLYATDRAVDELKIVDLDEAHTTFRSVIATAPMPENPVDIRLSGDGVYAYSVLQGQSPSASPRLVVTTIGQGPTIASMVPAAGQPGTQVVITGKQLTIDGDPCQVDFNGTIAVADRGDPNTIVVTVPAGVTSGPVTVRVNDPGNPVQVSNALHFDAIEPASPDGLRLAGTLTFPSTGSVFCDYMIRLAALSPDGNYLYTACGGGDFCFVFDIRPGSPKFNQVVGYFSVGQISNDLAITADGKVGIFATGGPPITIYVDPNDPRFGTQGPGIDFGMFPAGSMSAVATSPDNRYAVTMDGGAYYLIDATGLSDGVTPVALDQQYPPGIGQEVVFHPSGRVAYIINTSPAYLIELNTDPLSGGFNTASVVSIPTGPTSVDVSRDGHYVYTYSGNPNPNFDMVVARYNSTRPDSLFPDLNCLVATGAASALSPDNRLRIAPQGTFGLRTLQNTGFIQFDPACGPDQTILSVGVNSEFLFTPDGRRVYSANAGAYSLEMYDFLGAQNIAIASGDNQTGVTGQMLPAPIRVQVGTTLPGRHLDGVPVRFDAQNGGLFQVGDSLATVAIVATDADGYAEVHWKLGQLGTNNATATATGLTGSPLTFTAMANPDPSTLPLSLAEIIPLDGATGVSPTTALLATFSRGIDPTTVGPSTVYLRNTVTTGLVAATYGFADSNRRVSLTPSAPLALGTAYEMAVTTGVHAMGGGALTTPSTTGFTTVVSQPLRISSVSPPSALRGVTITVTGTGFDTPVSANVVWFNDVATTPAGGTRTSLQVIVPSTAAPGVIRVVAHGDSSNAVPFTVLTPNTSPIDEVIATVATSSGGRTCAVTPDGALCYTVSTDGNVIIPVNVAGTSTYASIPVGDEPVAIVISPDGSVAYVANFNSGTVSVIDVDPDSPTFNRVIQTITVGTNPIDVAISPDGARLAVANAGSSDVSIVDSDESSSAYNRVIGTAPTRNGATSVAISADGTIYAGTNTGFVIIDASNAVVGSAPTSGGAKSVAISPDGTLLFILSWDGDINVVDIREGSAAENQVIATVGGSSAGARSVAISADGTLLYLIPEVGDEVLVLAIDVIPGVSAIDPDAVLAPFNFSASFIDTIAVGRGPGDVVVDPSGSGTVFVVNTVDATLSILNGSSVPTGLLHADIRVTPRTLNLQSNGKYVTGRIELPAAFFPQEIDLSTVHLQQVIPAVPGSESYGDSDGDGIQELTVKFDRAMFQSVLPQGEKVPVTIDGMVRNRYFAGEDTIRTIRPTVTHPHAGEYILPGSSTTITWEGPAGPAADKADVHVSFDDGATWTPVALQTANTGSVPWTAPDAFYEQCRVMVTLWRNGDVYAQGMSDAFMVSAPVATALKSIDIGLEDGAAVLRWETNYEAGMDGFAIVRSESETGDYRAVTAETIRASGAMTGGKYEYRDDTVHANRTYWYKLQEVTSDGPGAEFGPYSVVYRLSYGLDQNMPNPFNPTTTIKYSLAADGDVNLVVYDVTGQRVRELVNGRQRADVYHVVWDGRNDRGAPVASGMYFYKLVAGRFTQTRKMMLLK